MNELNGWMDGWMDGRSDGRTEMVVFVEGGKLEYLEKKPGSRDKATTNSTTYEKTQVQTNDGHKLK